ncbi:DUF4231 domain-containing protein [Lachnospiraceae bacterium 48-21]
MDNGGKGEMRYYCCNGGGCDTKDYEEVVLAYIEYYHVRARRCKCGFYIFSVIKIVLIGMLPVLQAAGIVNSIPWIIAIFSSGILITESILELWRLKEKWILYRSTCNRLMTVQRQYVGKRENSGKEMEEYIAAVEAIISGEGDKWIEVSKDKKDDKDDSDK